MSATMRYATLHLESSLNGALGDANWTRVGTIQELSPFPDKIVALDESYKLVYETHSNNATQPKTQRKTTSMSAIE